jgi:hypothetical protein
MQAVCGRRRSRTWLRSGRPVNNVKAFGAPIRLELPPASTAPAMRPIEGANPPEIMGSGIDEVVMIAL